MSRTPKTKDFLVEAPKPPKSRHSQHHNHREDEKITNGEHDKGKLVDESVIVDVIAGSLDTEYKEIIKREIRKEYRDTDGKPSSKSRHHKGKDHSNDRHYYSHDKYGDDLSETNQSDSHCFVDSLASEFSIGSVKKDSSRSKESKESRVSANYDSNKSSSDRNISSSKPRRRNPNYTIYDNDRSERSESNSKRSSSNNHNGRSENQTAPRATDLDNEHSDNRKHRDRVKKRQNDDTDNKKIDQNHDDQKIDQNHDQKIDQNHNNQEGGDHDNNQNKDQDSSKKRDSDKDRDSSKKRNTKLVSLKKLKSWWQDENVDKVLANLDAHYEQYISDQNNATQTWIYQYLYGWALKDNDWPKAENYFTLSGMGGQHPEPYYELCYYYREQQQYEMAYLYLKLGFDAIEFNRRRLMADSSTTDASTVPIDKKSAVLWSDVHTYLLDYEMSILGFYLGDKGSVEARDSYNRLLSNISLLSTQIEASVLNNIPFVYSAVNYNSIYPIEPSTVKDKLTPSELDLIQKDSEVIYFNYLGSLWIYVSNTKQLIRNLSHEVYSIEKIFQSTAAEKLWPIPTEKYLFLINEQHQIGLEFPDAGSDDIYRIEQQIPSQLSINNNTNNGDSNNNNGDSNNKDGKNNSVVSDIIPYNLAGQVGFVVIESKILVPAINSSDYDSEHGIIKNDRDEIKVSKFSYYVFGRDHQTKLALQSNWHLVTRKNDSDKNLHSILTVEANSQSMVIYHVDSMLSQHHNTPLTTRLNVRLIDAVSGSHLRFYLNDLITRAEAIKTLSIYRGLQMFYEDESYVSNLIIGYGQKSDLQHVVDNQKLFFSNGKPYQLVVYNQTTVVKFTLEGVKQFIRTIHQAKEAGSQKYNSLSEILANII